MKTFYKLLGNTLVSGVTNSFLWFAITFWAYLETQSVLATSIIGGSYMLLTAALGLYFGTLVDQHRKKSVMLYSSVASFLSYCLASLVYFSTPESSLLDLGGVRFWAFVVFVLLGAVVGNLRMIALSTTVTLLVPAKRHDRANGLIGTVNGLAFSLTSVFSGLAVGLLGINWALAISLVLTVLTVLHLLTVAVPEEKLVHLEEITAKIDIKGALSAIKLVPGLMALIFFATFNNFLGGVYMALMDPYGLELVSVEAWGFIWGFLSLAFVLGGIIVVKKGLGTSPLRTLFLANIAMWLIAIGFPLRSSIVLLIIGFFVYMALIPVVEAAEQTIVQRVVPLAKQGRVFGFAQTVESAASPITAFLIGPIAQFSVIPFMTDGAGARTIGSWFGTGPDRGMALIFIVAGVIGLGVTLWAMRTKAYHILDKHYAGAPAELAKETVPATPRG